MVTVLIKKTETMAIAGYIDICICMGLWSYTTLHIRASLN